MLRLLWTIHYNQEVNHTSPISTPGHAEVYSGSMRMDKQNHFAVIERWESESGSQLFDYPGHYCQSRPACSRQLRGKTISIAYFARYSGILQCSVVLLQVYELRVEFSHKTDTKTYPERAKGGKTTKKARWLKWSPRARFPMHVIFIVFPNRPPEEEEADNLRRRAL